VRYPTFERVGDGWRNWNGYGVNALDHRVLKAMVRKILGPELRALQDAIIVPLGKANEMVEYLCTHGELDASRCVLGFPHPSPASARRHELFAARRRNIERQVDGLSQRDGWSTLPVQCDTTPMPEPIASARLAQPAPEPRRPRRTLFATYGVSDPLIQRTGY